LYESRRCIYSRSFIEEIEYIYRVILNGKQRDVDSFEEAFEFIKKEDQKKNITFLNIRKLAKSIEYRCPRFAINRRV